MRNGMYVGVESVTLSVVSSPRMRFAGVCCIVIVAASIGIVGGSSYTVTVVVVRPPKKSIASTTRSLSTRRCGGELDVEIERVRSRHVHGTELLAGPPVHRHFEHADHVVGAEPDEL